jgi:hypothetical protein
VLLFTSFFCLLPFLCLLPFVLSFATSLRHPGRP